MNITLAKRRMAGRSRKGRSMYNNDFSVLNPTIWANEAILQLQPNMVLASLVSRDFDTKVAKFGDIVNAFVPSTFVANRKGALCDNVVVQDASGSAVQVPLNQWPQVSFLICDGEEDRSALDLVDTLLVPAVIALAQQIDRILGAQVMHFTGISGGHLGLLDSTTALAYLLDTREAMNRKNVPLVGRTMILTPSTETQALQVQPFIYANEVGDDGTALREAALGRKFGFDMYMTQTQPEVAAQTGSTIVSTTTTAAAAAGATVVAATSATGLAVGMWIVVGGDDTPQQITAVNSLNLTISPGLKRAIASGATVVAIKGGAVNNTNGYVGTSLSPRVIGWAKEILIDGVPTGGAPQVGQMITFNTDTQRYTIIGVRIIGSGAFGITLDVPLVTAIADNDTVNFGPAGKYNFAFLRQALALINRPLPQPRAGTGALAKVVSDPVNKISIRVTITYDGEKQGHLVTLDTLIGVGVLNQNLGAVMLG